MTNTGNAGKLLSSSRPAASYGGTNAPRLESNSGIGATSSGQLPATGNAKAEHGKGIRRVFPFEPCSCFAQVPWIYAILQIIFPSTWLKVQNLPHLVLLVGTIASLILLVETAASWWYYGCRTRYCQGRWLPLMFVSLCVLYFIRTIAQYDDDLQNKQKLIEAAKQEVGSRCDEVVRDMDKCMKKTMDTQATLAERFFEAYRRDLLRFLLRLRQKLESPEGASLADSPQFLEQFRAFMVHWFAFFSRCSIDPVNRKLEVMSADELYACPSAAKLAEVVGERLKVVEVRFISHQRAIHVDEISKTRSAMQSLQKLHAKALNLGSSLAGKKPPAERDEEAPFPTCSNEAQEDEAVPERRWLHWSAQWRVSVEYGDNDDDMFPITVHCGCFMAVLMSSDHAQLVASFLLGWPILLLELCLRSNAKFQLVSEVIVCMVCLSFVLYEFLDLDIVQKLDTQLHELEEATRSLEAKREKLRSFYSGLQGLADVWLHLVVPCLEVMKFVHDEILDVPDSECVVILTDANRKIKALQESIPPVEFWQVMSIEEMKQIGNQLHNLTRDGGIREALLKMPGICNWLTDLSASLALKAKA